MTATSRRKIYNFNLFLLIIALGALMYWQKNVRVKDYSLPIISETSSISSSVSLTQVKFKE